MAGRGGNKRQVLLPPITFIFKLMQDQKLVRFHLVEKLNIHIDGLIRGFDEFMNVVIENAVEIKTLDPKTDPKTEGEKRRDLGLILLKGDNIAMLEDRSR